MFMCRQDTYYSYKNKNMPKVSIVVPVYKAELFLEETIQTVLNQTYENWEMLLINDCSPDASFEIAEKYLGDKIKWFEQEINSGAGLTRNRGIKEATGKYICFLDADDLWDIDKLEKQVAFMEEKDCEFSFTSYEFANRDGVPNGNKVIVPEKINYNQALKNVTIWTSTVMFNMEKLTKEDIYMSDIRRGQDAATWWKVLKKVDHAYGIKDIFSYYRRTQNSLSANKLIALKRTWYLYRKVEKFGILKSSYYFVFSVLNAIRRRI